MAGKDFTKHFGERLREIRIAKGLSQEQLAHAAGLHRTHISLIERNHRSVRLESLRQLAFALEVQPAALIPEIDLKHNGKQTRSSSRQSKAR